MTVKKEYQGQMDFSLFYFAAEDDRLSNKYDLLIEGSKFADKNDFSAIWIPERHFNSFGGRFPNPSVAAAAVAVVTNKIKIRSGSVVLPLHDPVRIAEEWSMVDHFSNGRIELGVASGWAHNDFVLAPDNWQDRQKKTCAALQTIQHLWEGNSCTRKNGLEKDFEFTIFPKPLQNKLPIWISAGGNEETFRYAGSIGAKLVTNLVSQSVEKAKSNIAAYYEALEKGGFDRSHGKVALMIHTFIGEDQKSAEKIVREPLIRYLSYFTDLLEPTKSSVDISKSRDFLYEMAYQRFLVRGGLFGSPQSCLARIQAFKEMGINEIACLIDFGVEDSIVLEHLPYIAKLKELIRERELDCEFSSFDPHNNSSSDAALESA